MIKIIPKYIIREHFGPFIFALLAINLTFILNVLFRDLGKFLSKGLPLTVILEFLFLNLAWMIALSVPMAVLTATLMAFGRLTADNEITAIRASGISFFQILPQVMFAAALLAAGLVWFNNSVLPDFNHQARLLAMDINRKKPTINLDSGVFYTELPNYSILVQGIQEQDTVSYVDNVTIFDQSDGNVIKTIIADSGKIQVNAETGFLEFLLFDGALQEIDIMSLESFKRLEFPRHVIKIPAAEMMLRRSESGFRGDREKSAQDLLKDVAKNNKSITEKRQRLQDMITTHLAKYSQMQLTNGITWDAVLEEHRKILRQVRAEVNMIDAFERQNDIYLVEVHKKYAIPAACVVFILIGAPLGIMTKRGGMLLGAGVSLGFFLLYWVCLIGGESLADRQIISPAVSMWSPNVIVGIAGLILVYRLIKK